MDLPRGLSSCPSHSWFCARIRSPKVRILRGTMKTTYPGALPAVRIVLTTVALLVGGSALAEMITSSRRVAWQNNVGVAGGIPSSSTKTVFTTIPAGASHATVQNAINNCPPNQVIQLSAGSYTFDNALNFFGADEGVVLRGTVDSNGNPTTHITFTGTGGSPANVMIYAGFNGLSTDANLSVDAVKGQNTVTLASVPSWVTVGELIGIDQLDESSFVSDTGTEGGQGYRALEGQGSRNMGQINRVTAKTSTTITLEIPLYYGYKVSQTAQIFQPGYNTVTSIPKRGLGFENIHFNSTVDHPAIHFFKVESGDSIYWKNCFIENCPGGAFIWTFMSYRLQVERCHFKDSRHLGGGSGYGTAWYHLTTACLVQNSIFELLHNAMTGDFGAAGNVWAYNYELDGQSDSGQNPGMNTHGVHCYMNLWEGNYTEDKLLADWTHGSASHNTVFRNRITGENGSGDRRTCVSIEYYNRYWNVVGNILGVNGLQNKRVSHSGSSSEGSQGNILKMGGVVNINNNYSTSDTYSYTSGMFVLDHRNYDHVTDGIVNEASGTITDTVLPNSLYLSAKPAWFGNLTWPPFDPANPNAASVDDIPAGYRYLNGADPPAGGGGGNQPPLAQASANPLSGAPPLIVAFSSAGSMDPEGAALTYSWVFGDGASSTAANPSHTYQAAGTYTARLTVSDGTNSTQSGSVNISVTSNGGGSVGGGGLVAAYGFEEGSGNLTADSSGLGNHGDDHRSKLESGQIWECLSIQWDQLCCNSH